MHEKEEPSVLKRLGQVAVVVGLGALVIALLAPDLMSMVAGGAFTAVGAWLLRAGMGKS